jgi:ABC-type nitrate/sulfonate/bicarbonate transport system substrate-binding protein
MDRPSAIRIEIPAAPDLSDLPRLMAVDALRAKGYNIEAVAIDDVTVAVQAMNQGALDISNLPNLQAWAAIDKGASIVTILDDAAATRLLAAAPGIEQCGDLDGKKVATVNVNSVQTAMVNRYIEENCPGAAPEYLVVAGANNRMAGLLAGQVDAALLDMTQQLRMERDGETRAHVLVSFTEEFPTLKTNSHFARRDFLEQYPEAARDFVRAMLEARRSIQDPHVLSEQFVKYIKLEPVAASSAAETYLAHKVWDVNGALSPELLQENIDFLVELSGLAPGITPEEIADLSYLNAVLEEIGRR